MQLREAADAGITQLGAPRALVSLNVLQEAFSLGSRTQLHFRSQRSNRASEVNDDASGQAAVFAAACILKQCGLHETLSASDGAQDKNEDGILLFTTIACRCRGVFFPH